VTDPDGARSDPVAWDVALGVARQAVRLVGDPVGEPERAALQLDLDEITAKAESLVVRASGLVARGGPTRARVISRQGWVEANVGSFRRLLRPVGARLAASPKGRRAMSPASKIAAGIEVGLVLGWMSGRVLGQYDLLPGEPGEEDAIYYVAPNLLALERQHGFPSSQFRLWIALHEVTHRLQLTGVEWMRDYFFGLVERGTELASPSPSALLASVRRAGRDLREGRNPLAEGGLVALLASADQLATLQEAQALMSLLEGHADVIMDRAATDQIPEGARFASVLHERRTSPKGVAKTVQQLIGLEAKMRQYAEGERFVERALEVGGDDLLAVVWSDPSMLPSLAEVREPERWIERATARMATRA